MSPTTYIAPNILLGQLLLCKPLDMRTGNWQLKPENEPTPKALKNLKFLAQNYLAPLYQVFGHFSVINCYRSELVEKLLGIPEMVKSPYREGLAIDLRCSSWTVAIAYSHFLYKRFIREGYGYDLLWMGDAKDSSRDYVWLHLRLAEHLFDNRLDMRVVEKPDWLILE